MIGEEDSLMLVDSAPSDSTLPESEAITEDANITTVSQASESETNDVEVSQDSMPEDSILANASQDSQDCVGVVVKKTLNRMITEDVTYKVTEAKDIIEYEWPPKSGEKWMVSEQISELINVKGFKRKYGEMTSRQIKKEEKEFLIGVHKINSLLSELHMQFMTALRATEVHDMLAREFPGVYSEYQRISTERMKEKMAEQQKEMDLMKQDPKLLEELRQKAMVSAREYNTELQLYKKNERGSFWDLQTSILQSSIRKWKRLPASITKPNPYPVALIHGQFQHYYRKYDKAEMRKLPLGSVLDGENLFPVYREPSPPPITVKESDLLMATTNTPVRISKDELKDDKSFTSRARVEVTPGARAAVRPLSENVVCDVCSEGKIPEYIMLRCSSCTVTVHAECSEMSSDQGSMALTYNWNCIDCKRCTECAKPDNEDKMMFCDRCDRGYHTFCVGLKEPPIGKWKCARFCGGERRHTDRRSTARRVPA